MPLKITLTLVPRTEVDCRMIGDEPSARPRSPVVKAEGQHDAWAVVKQAHAHRRMPNMGQV
jgi:hypothetical protein